MSRIVLYILCFGAILRDFTQNHQLNLDEENNAFNRVYLP